MVGADGTEATRAAVYDPVHDSSQRALRSVTMRRASSAIRNTNNRSVPSSLRAEQVRLPRNGLPGIRPGLLHMPKVVRIPRRMTMRKHAWIGTAP